MKKRGKSSPIKNLRKTQISNSWKQSLSDKYKENEKMGEPIIYKRNGRKKRWGGGEWYLISYEVRKGYGVRECLSLELTERGFEAQMDWTVWRSPDLAAVWRSSLELEAFLGLPMSISSLKNPNCFHLPSTLPSSFKQMALLSRSSIGLSCWDFFCFLNSPQLLC